MLNTLHKRGLRMLLCQTTLAGLLVLTPHWLTPSAKAQESQAVAVNLASQSLGQALSGLADQTGLQMILPTGLVEGKTSPALQGMMTADEALSRLLAGSGLTHRFTSANSVTITGPQSQLPSGTSDDPSMLGTIYLGGGRAFWDGSAETVYSTTGAVSHIGAEALSNCQITTPGDILRGTTGVLSGENRNSGSLDVNIHGLQGQGRVKVTVDGSENAAVVSQGYQGVADRTFVDPDFISSAAINKNGDAARSAIGGSVAISTLSVDDLVKTGEKIGFRLKPSAWGNTTEPEYLRQGGWAGNASSGFSRRESLAQPGLLNPTAGSASFSFGLKGDRVDLVAGYATRNSGNYHAGTNGREAANLYRGPGNASNYTNGGLTTYFGGEEVMNTSSETESGMLKATFHLAEDLDWRLTYSHYDTTFGEVMASRQSNGWVAGQQGSLSNTRLNTLTSRLHYNPAGNPLVDLTWNIWKTKLDSASATNFQFLSGSQLTRNEIWGTDISNRSYFDTGLGAVDVTFGASWKSEETSPVNPDAFTLARNGTREERSLFATSEWAVSEEITLSGSLRYTRYASDDRNTTALSRNFRISDETFGGSLGLAWKASDDLTFYANYQDFSRLPSLFETVSMGASTYSPIAPERAHNIDLGLNATFNNLWSDGDGLALKLSYFDKNIDDYIVRQAFGNPFRLLFINIDKARFSGIDLGGTYSLGGFAAAFSATYYTGMEFCRTADTCLGSSLASDYTTNHIPPKYHLTLDLSQKFLEDRLTLGGRLTRVGPRAADAETPVIGGSAIIAPVEWDPYTTLDLYSRYRLTGDMEVAFDVQNVTDSYYVDPLAQGQIPAPGRTARLTLDWRF